MKTLEEQLGSEWFEVLKSVFDTREMGQLATRLSIEKNIEPAQGLWFRAFNLCQPSQIKVIILGQDPYAAGYADGLAFSTSDKSIPPSLQVIFNELKLEYGVIRKQSDLSDWARQGVLLINTVLTTRYKQPLAHKDWGWERFMRRVFYYTSTLKQPYVVMAWGGHAQETVRENLLDAPEILTACHPQAENFGSKRFTGCGHFKKANEFLINHGVKPIKWI